MTDETKIAGNGSSNGSGIAWSVPSNITASDGNAANFSLEFDSGPLLSQELVANNFGFTIDSSATINGVEVTIRKRLGSGGGTSVVDKDVRLILNTGSYSGTNKALSGEWGGTFSVTTYGGSSDLWGETLTPVIINHTNFGAVLIAEGVGFFASGFVDYIEITVYYTAGSGPGIAHRVLFFGGGL